MTYFGADVSHYQKGLSVARLKKQGYSFVMAKCTQGTSYADPEYDRFRHQAKKAFMPFAAYHFLEHGNPEGQALWLLKNIGDKRIKVMVDFEPTGFSHPNMHDWRAFRKKAHEIGLHVTLLYFPHFYWSELNRPSLKNLNLGLVQAMYPLSSRRGFGSTLYHSVGGNNARGWEPQGGLVPEFWQFTSSGHISGYSGNVDIQAFRGTKHQLESYFTNYDVKPKAKNILQMIHYKHLAMRNARKHNHMNRFRKLKDIDLKRFL